jgi:hypothetical protein
VPPGANREDTEHEHTPADTDRRKHACVPDLEPGEDGDSRGDDEQSKYGAGDAQHLSQASARGVAYRAARKDGPMSC